MCPTKSLRVCINSPRQRVVRDMIWNTKNSGFISSVIAFACVCLARFRSCCNQCSEALRPRTTIVSHIIVSFLYSIVPY
jgi:hypothetical protein